MSEAPKRAKKASDKPLPKCRECRNEPSVLREIDYSLGIEPYTVIKITVPSCWRCGRWSLTPDAEALIQSEMAKRTSNGDSPLFEGVKA